MNSKMNKEKFILKQQVNNKPAGKGVESPNKTDTLVKKNFPENLAAINTVPSKNSEISTSISEIPSKGSIKTTHLEESGCNYFIKPKAMETLIARNFPPQY